MSLSNVETNNMSKLHSDSRVWKWEGDGSCTSWDGLRRDNDLWVPEGDCLIYLYDEGQSRRGASIRIPYRLLFDARCSSLTAFATSELSEPQDPSTTEKKLYLGAPSELPREEAFNWHLTTRNFFAWLLGKPLVGTHLSRAMIDLLGRMALYREGFVDNVSDLMDYADDLGYSNITGRPDLALAMLSFADEFKLSSLWIDAFAHCVGMREDLRDSVEYETTRTVNKALITRAALQMDLSLDRATRHVHTLGEEDLSTAFVQFFVGARRHMDRFRSFLQSHLVSSHGSWPPRQDAFPKQIYVSLRSDFESLYNYLADSKSNIEQQTSQPSGHGIDAAQILDSLCARHSFTPLPFTLPLLPRINNGAGHRTQAHWALRGAKLGGNDQKQSAVDIARNAYRQASNGPENNNALVKAYMQFEFEDSKSFDDQLSFGDVRKIRWILTCYMLQQLRAITKAPADVKDAVSAPYPLCCPEAGIPPWNNTNSGPSLLRTTSQLRNTEPSSQSNETLVSRRPEVTRRKTALVRTQTVSNSTADRPVSMSWLESTNPWLSEQPQVPEKSKRRSVLPPKSLARSSSTWAQRPISIAIPDRSTSRRSVASSIEEDGGSVTSDTVPSLSYSQHSPTLSSSSAGRASPTSGSSSIYSADDTRNGYEIDEPAALTHDFFTQDAGFVAPGLDFYNPKHELANTGIEGIDFGVFGARNL